MSVSEEFDGLFVNFALNTSSVFKDSYRENNMPRNIINAKSLSFSRVLQNLYATCMHHTKYHCIWASFV